VSRRSKTRVALFRVSVLRSCALSVVTLVACGHHDAERDAPPAPISNGWSVVEVDRFVASVLMPSEEDREESARRVAAIRENELSRVISANGVRSYLDAKRLSDWDRLDLPSSSTQRVSHLLTLARTIDGGYFFTNRPSPGAQLLVAASRTIDTDTAFPAVQAALDTLRMRVNDTRVEARLLEALFARCPDRESRFRVGSNLIHAHLRLGEVELAIASLQEIWRDHDLALESDPGNDLTRESEARRRFRVARQLYELYYAQERHAAAWHWFQRAVEFEHDAGFRCRIAVEQWHERRDRDRESLRDLAESSS